MEEKSLKDKTIKGTIWSATDAFLGQGVTFIVGLVLARLLSPEEYGLIGIVTIFTTISFGFVDCGFGNSLIRKQDVDNEDLSTMFIVNMGMSIVMYLILYAGAPVIAYFFDRPQLLALIRVTGTLLIIQSFSIVQDTILKKRIDFKTKTKASFISAFLSGLLGIGMALLGCGVWSLVGQLLMRQLVYSICLWYFNHWTPSFSFCKDSFKYMWGFGWKLMLSGFIDRLWGQLYQVVVGKFYNPAVLGHYTRAEQLASVFSSNLTTIVQRVSYPVFSSLQDNRGRLVGGYRRVIKTTMFITAVLLFFIAAVAQPLVYCLLGPQWHLAVRFLPLICLSMVLYPLHAINLNMLQVQGRTDIFLYLEIVKKGLAIGPICLGIFVNIYWMLIGGILLSFVCFFLNSFYSGKLLGYGSMDQLRDVAPSFGISVVIAFSVYFLKFLPLTYWYILPIQLFVGAVVFFFLCETFKVQEYYEIKDTVSGYLGSLLKKLRCYGK